MRGSAISAAMCGRLAMPIGPRASSMVISTPKRRERLDEHAHRRQRAMVDHGPGPVEDRRPSGARRAVPWRSVLRHQVVDDLLGDGEGGAGAGAAGDRHQPHARRRAGRPASAGPVPRRRCRSSARSPRAPAAPRPCGTRPGSARRPHRARTGRAWRRSGASRRRPASRPRSAPRSGGRRWPDARGCSLLEPALAALRPPAARHSPDSARGRGRTSPRPVKRGSRGAGRDPQHVQLAARQAVGGEAVGEQARGNRRPGRRRSARPAACRAQVSTVGGLDGAHRVWRRNVTPCASASQRASAGIAPSGFDPQLVRAPQHRAQARLRQHREALGAPRARSAARSPRPSRWPGTPPARPPPRAAAPPRRGRDARRGCRPAAPSRPRRRASAWRVASSRPRCWPVTVTKPKLRIEAPFACASRSITTTLAQPRRGQRMGEAADPGPDHREIERAGDGCAHRIRLARGRARDRPDPTACRCLRWRPR